MKYTNWNGLIEDGYFAASKRNRRVLYFTKKGIAAAGPLSVKRRYHYYVEHDVVAAKILLSLEKTDRVARSWTEAELRAAPWEAISLLGSGDAAKLPDLVVDLKGADGFVRIGFEIEASRKSRERYDQISFTYLAMKRINLIVFVCENGALEKQVQKSFGGSLFVRSEKTPATVLIGDLENCWLDAKTRFLGRELTLREMLSRAIKAPLAFKTDTQDERKIPVLSENSKPKETST